MNKLLQKELIPTKLILSTTNMIAGSKRKKILSGTVVLAIAISLVHLLTFSHKEIYLDFLHQLLTKLYFLPVLLAALYLGIKGAIKLALVVSFLYLPHSMNTGLFTKFYIAENLSELVLIWVVGIIAGVLIDRLKKVQTEKARLAALEKVSTVINVVNNDIMNDYSACMGLTKSLASIHNNGDGNSFTVKLLSEKLERLGSHISHLANLAAPKPVNKIKYNFSHLTKKCVSEIIQNNPGYNFSFMSEAKLPPIYMDVGQIEFALKHILQSFLEQSAGKKELAISAAKNNEMVEISLTLNGKGKSAKNRGTEVFDLISNPEKGYSFALASSIISLHNGNVKFETGESGIKSIYLNMPVNEI
ncbi:hypothetical protein APF79_06945 [bacterium BRH_c32]|nr:MAG: hypothetical protein APF79_06945 [bacterium BRH_c32]